VNGGRLSILEVTPLNEFSAEKEANALICEDLRMYVTHLGNDGVG
jgi:hypothetical protein